MLVSEQGPFMEINLKLKLSLAERHQIIELPKFSRFSQRNIAKKFGCSKAQIQTTLDNREYYLKQQLRTNETVATLNAIPSTSTQQQSQGASTTTTTTSSMSTAEGAGLSEHRRSNKKLSLAEQMQVIEIRKTSGISQQKLALQFGCSKTQIQTTLDKMAEIQMKFNVAENPHIVNQRRSYLMTNPEKKRIK